MAEHEIYSPEERRAAQDWPWRNAHGVEASLSELESSHLANLVGYLERRIEIATAAEEEDALHAQGLAGAGFSGRLMDAADYEEALAHVRIEIDTRMRVLSGDAPQIAPATPEAPLRDEPEIPF